MIKVKPILRYLSAKEIVSSVTPGSFVYFVDKERPGVYAYVSGVVSAVEESDVTVAVENYGTFSAPGEVPYPHEMPFQKGEEVSLNISDWTPYAPKDFEVLRGQTQEVPEKVTGPLSPFELGEEPLPENTSPELDEDEDVLSPLSPVELSEDPEEGAPAAEDEDDWGLYLQASLNTWAKTEGILWPKGFSPREWKWMGDVYDSLSEGEAATPSGSGLTDLTDAGPALASPAGKGLFRKKLAITEKAQRDMEAASAESKKLYSEISALEEKLNAATDADETKKLRDELSEKEKAYANSNARYADALNEWKKASTAYDEAGEQEEYEAGHGRHISHEESRGKGLLRQELKTLSDKYKKTLEMYDEFTEAQKRAIDAAKELNLTLAVGQRRLVEKKPGQFVLPKAWEEHRVSSQEALKNLREFKRKQFLDLPYVWNDDERQTFVESIGPLFLEGPDDQKETSPIWRNLKKFTDGPVSFYDVPHAVLEERAKRDAETKEGVGQSTSQKIKLAEDATDKYIDHVNRFIGYKFPWKQIQAYIRGKYRVRIVEETAKRLEHIRPGDSLKIAGYDADGNEQLITVSSKDVEAALAQLIEPFKKRVLLLKTVRDGLDANVEKIRGKLERHAVEKDFSLEKGFKDKLESAQEVASAVKHFAALWRTKSTRDKQRMLASDVYRTIVQKTTDLRAALSHLGKSEGASEFINADKLAEADAILNDAAAALTSNRFAVASEHLGKLDAVVRRIPVLVPISEQKYKDAIVDAFKKVAKTEGLTELVPSKVKLEEGTLGYRKKLDLLEKTKQEVDRLEKKIADIMNRMKIKYEDVFRADEAFLTAMYQIGRSEDPAAASADLSAILSEEKSLTERIAAQRKNKDGLLKLYSRGKITLEKLRQNLEYINNYIENLKAERSTLLRGEISEKHKQLLNAAVARADAAQEEYTRATASLREELEAAEEARSSVKSKWQGLAAELELDVREEKKK